MHNRSNRFLFLTMSLAIGAASSAKAFDQGNIIVVGKIPSRYLGHTGNTAELGKITITQGRISNIEAVDPSRADSIRDPRLPVVHAVNKSTNQYDILYPGLINLHNHTKQNVLSVWEEARGQFENRFEWRAWGIYKKSVSANMNPWIEYGKPMSCAAFRWSEIQAMVLGTTYLQGPSSCVGNFAIHQVEDSDAYDSNKTGVAAPTDVILPGEMVFVWNTLRPLIEGGLTYEEALKKVVLENCPKLAGKINDVNGRAELAILGDQDALKSSCRDEKDLPEKFIRYVYWIHKTIAGKKTYFADPNAGALIAHLAEGRRFSDPYNTIEYEMIKLLGLLRPHVNFVHGVGIDPRNFPEMAANQVGLIWSPFSNLLLYGETLDVATAAKAGIDIALGSDWLPTGTRGVLEELKIARDYRNREKLPLTDEQLYDMVTTNPAKMINQTGKVGTLTKGAMGSIISISDSATNPFSNLVNAEAKDVNLVIVDGRPVYGNVSYLQQADPAGNFEVLADLDIDSSKLGPGIIEDLSKIGGDDASVKLVQSRVTASLAIRKGAVADNCHFTEPKGFINQQSLKQNDLLAFQKTSGFNLDRFEDIQRLLALGMLTQSKNLNDKKEGDPNFAVKRFSPIYSCKDPAYEDRVKNMIGKEMEENLRGRDQLRKQQRLGSVPKNMAQDYRL